MSTFDIFDTPARQRMASATGRLLGRLVLAASGIQVRHRRHREARVRRDAFETMRGLDDHILRDIGLTRADVEYGMSLPVELDAARILKREKHLR